MFRAALMHLMCKKRNDGNDDDDDDDGRYTHKYNYGECETKKRPSSSP